MIGTTPFYAHRIWALFNSWTLDLRRKLFFKNSTNVPKDYSNDLSREDRKSILLPMLQKGGWSIAVNCKVLLIEVSSKDIRCPNQQHNQDHFSTLDVRAIVPRRFCKMENRSLQEHFKYYRYECTFLLR
jgi:hypothetical protein